MYTNPSQSDFETFFYRDFPYGTDPTVSVTPTDIANAFALTNITINQGLWPDQSSYNIGYLYLTAHYLVLNLRAGSQGLNGQWNWTQTNKAVSGVSEAFAIPQRLIDNAELMAYTKTNYGNQYLMLLLPILSGQMFTVCGRTKP